MKQTIKYKTDNYTEWLTQAGNFTTTYMVNVEFTLPDFSAKKIVE